MVLEKAFCCCKLETGGIAIAILSGISSVFLIVIFSLLFWYEGLKHHLDLQIIAGIYMVLSFINLFATALIIIGVKQKNRNLILPWLVIASLQLIPTIPFALFISVIAFPFVFPYYVWHCMFSLYKSMDPLNEKVTSIVKFFYPQQPNDATANHMYNNLEV